MQDGLKRMLKLLTDAATTNEKCSAAIKTRFAWVQYKYKIQEAHDFIATNMDLYQSSFRIGKERLKRSTKQVLYQMDSVQSFLAGQTPPRNSVGELMMDVSLKVSEVESKLQASGCF
jgi:hypothetical protein